MLQTEETKSEGLRFLVSEALTLTSSLIGATTDAGGFEGAFINQNIPFLPKEAKYSLLIAFGKPLIQSVINIIMALPTVKLILCSWTTSTSNPDNKVVSMNILRKLVG